MGTEYEVKLGKNIQKLRKMRELSQEQLAKKLQLAGSDISSYTLSRIELCQKHVRADELKSLKEVFGVTFDELMEI